MNRQLVRPESPGQRVAPADCNWRLFAPLLGPFDQIAQPVASRVSSKSTNSHNGDTKRASRLGDDSAPPMCEAQVVGCQRISLLASIRRRSGWHD